MPPTPKSSAFQGLPCGVAHTTGYHDYSDAPGGLPSPTEGPGIQGIFASARRSCWPATWIQLRLYRVPERAVHSTFGSGEPIDERSREDVRVCGGSRGSARTGLRQARAKGTKCRGKASGESRAD